MSDEIYTQAQEYNNQGLTLYAKNKYDEALEYFQKAIAEDKYFIDSYINSAQVYIMRDQYDDAVKNLNKASLIDKKNAAVYFHLGNIELLKGNSEGAREQYNKAISLGFDNVQIYINLATDCADHGDFDSAISYYNKAIAIDKFNAFAQSQKIQILIVLKRYPEALKACDTLIESNPDVFEGYHFKQAILLHQGKLTEAEEVLNRALTLFPDDESFYYDKAQVLHAQGRFEEALKLLDEKIQVTEDLRPTLVAFKAQLLLGMNRVDEAKTILEAEFQTSGNSEVAFYLTSIYVAGKEYAEALEPAERIIKNNDNDEYYYAALYYHAISLSRLGRTDEANKELENALRIFRAACSRKPGQLQLYFYRAIGHKELKQYQKALELTEYVLNVEPSIAEAHVVRAEIFREMGKEAEYQKERQAISSLKPELLEAMEV